MMKLIFSNYNIKKYIFLDNSLEICIENLIWTILLLFIGISSINHMMRTIYLQGYTIERSWITKYVLIAQNLEVMINLHTPFQIISRRVYLNEGQF